MIIVSFQNIPKQLLIGLVMVLFVSCKSGKILSNGTVDKNLSAKAIIKAHYQNALNFKTINGKMKIDYSDGENNQAVSVSIRMEKDKAIWISAPFGIVKAYITPERVSFYNKLENNYFDGDFSYLSILLGTDLDFNQVQNMLIGQSLFNLRNDKYDMDIADQNYQLKPRKVAELFKALFQIEPKNFKIASQQLAQPLKKRLLKIEYQNYQKINKWVLPNEILITAYDNLITNTIAIEYRNMEFNNALNFPYRIPKGYKEIVLDKDDI